MDQKPMFGQAQWVCAGAYSAPTSRALDAGGVPHFPILRSHFSAGDVRKATLRVLGLGFYHCYINGKYDEDLHQYILMRIALKISKLKI